MARVGAVGCECGLGVELVWRYDVWGLLSEEVEMNFMVQLRRIGMWQHSVFSSLLHWPTVPEYV
jgi:hypothetical protein